MPSARLDANRPRDLHLPRLGEGAERLRIGDVDEGDLELPHRADRTDRELPRRIVDEDLKARALLRRREIVHPERERRGIAAEHTRRKRA
jgi:hypothetical protein